MKEIVKPIIGNHVAAHDRFPHVPTQAAHLGYGGLGVLVDGPGDDGVLHLFAVSSSCRGKGIGKMLFQSALNYMKQEKLKEFYLFTDTSCNYGFYEHQGMKRRLEKKHVFNIKGQQAVMNFFIYDYQLSN